MRQGWVEQGVIIGIDEGGVRMTLVVVVHMVERNVVVVTRVE